MKQEFLTTKKEREIIEMLPSHNIEQWARNKEYWKIFVEVIKATEEYHGLR